MIRPGLVPGRAGGRGVTRSEVFTGLELNGERGPLSDENSFDESNFVNIVEAYTRF